MIANLSKGILYAYDRELQISSRVRNELNSLRSLTEKPVLSIPDNKPVMPRPFPAGRWKVTRPQARNSKELAPYFIPTNAFRHLPVWSTIDGHYGIQTDEIVTDKGYGIHFSEYMNTIGCIKIHDKKDLLWLVERINADLDAGVTIFLEVIE